MLPKFQVCYIDHLRNGYKGLNVNMPSHVNHVKVCLQCVGPLPAIRLSATRAVSEMDIHSLNRHIAQQVVTHFMSLRMCTTCSGLLQRFY